MKREVRVIFLPTKNSQTLEALPWPPWVFLFQIQLLSDTQDNKIRPAGITMSSLLQ